MREPGVARHASNFLLLRQKKVTKEKATPSLRPLRGAKGQTCVVSVAGCAVELTALRCSFVQTSTASQFTKHGRFDAHATPQPPRRRRSQQGWDSRTANIHSGHRCARPIESASLNLKYPFGLSLSKPCAALRQAQRERFKQIRAVSIACAARGACARETGPSAAQRSNGPRGCPSGSLLDAPGARRARGGTRVGARVLRDLTHRSCPSGAPQARSEFCGAPRDRAPQVAPQRSEGVADSRVALSLVTFFRRRERKLLACRATPGLCPSHRHTICFQMNSK